MIVISSPYPEAAIRALAAQLPADLGFSPEDVRTHIWTPRVRPSSVLRAVRLPWLSAATMYVEKIVFDHLVGLRLRSAEPAVVVCMMGSADRTFRRSRSAFKVLNFVNAYPRDHNATIRSSGGGKRDPELVPSHVVRRIDRELAAADLVVVPSQRLAGQLVAAGTPVSKICVSPYGVDATVFASPARGVHPRTTLKLLYVGQISKRKGITRLSTITTALRRPHELTLVGPVVDRGLLGGLPPDCHRSTVGQAELADLYRSHDAFVFPTNEDTFGLVVLEAMSAGLPVVVSSAAGASEIVGGGGIVFDVDDPDAVVERLEGLTAEDLRSMSEAAVVVAAGLTWERFTATVSGRIDDRSASRAAER